VHIIIIIVVVVVVVVVVSISYTAVQYLTQSASSDDLTLGCPNSKPS